MGVIESSILASLCSLASTSVGLASLFKSTSVEANPTIAAIEMEIERALNEKCARLKMDKARFEEWVQQEAERLRSLQEEVNRVRRAQDDADRARWAEQAEMERRLQNETGKTRQAQEELQRVLRAQHEADEMRRVQQEASDLRRTQEEAEWRRHMQQQADDLRRAREEAQQARVVTVEAEQELRRVTAARVEIEEKWRAGIQPEVWPTAQELQDAKRRHGYVDGLFHFAIAGVSGSGKSSLINALRGLRNNAPGAAPTGIVETTATISRHIDPNPDNPFVFYDIPGAGTLNVPDWQYFNSQGLFIFDCIIVLFDQRFTSTDVAILKNCLRFGIPSYIARSKANQHIRNIMEDNGYSDDDDESQYRLLYQAAREQLITETQQNVRQNIQKAQLPQQRVYIIAKETILGVVQGRMSEKIIDELDLVHDLLSDARARRLSRSSSISSSRAFQSRGISSSSSRIVPT